MTGEDKDSPGARSGRQPQGARRGLEVRSVDPRMLVVRANVRTAAAADPELVESIRANGIIQPPVVYADGGDLVLIAGHRRTAAAIAAGLDRIDVLVGPPLLEAGRLGAQVSENTNRSGLTAAEVADAVQQMTLLGLPAGQIAKAAGLRKAQVDAARAVATASRTVKDAVAGAPALTLEQAAVLAEQGDDRDAVEALLAGAAQGPLSFEHTAAQIAARRERAAQLAAAAEHWASSGYTVLNPDGATAVLDKGQAFVRDLAGADGQRLHAGHSGVCEAHAGCPDRAVVLSRWQPEQVQEVCLDPKRNGHQPARPTGGGGKGTQQQERAKVIEGNKLWKIASGVRLAHLRTVVRGGRFSRDLVDALHRHLLAHPSHLPEDWKRRLYFELLDFPGSGVAKEESGHGLLKTAVDPAAPANRVVGQLLAAVADGGERDLAQTTWRAPNKAAADYLTLLVAHTGYQLSDIETAAVHAVRPAWKPQATPLPAAGKAPMRRAARTAHGEGAGRGTTAAPAAAGGNPARGRGGPR